MRVTAILFNVIPFLTCFNGEASVADATTTLKNLTVRTSDACVNDTTCRRLVDTNVTILDVATNKSETTTHTEESNRQESETVRNVTVEMDFKWIQFRKARLNRTSPLFGSLNENVSIAFYYLPVGEERHVASLYGSSMTTPSKNYSVLENNNDIELIFSKLGNVSWPFGRHNQQERKLFTERLFLEMDFVKDNADESLLSLEEFKNNLDIDRSLPNCFSCSCAVYAHNLSGDGLKKYLFCFSPWYTTEQQSVLYAAYFKELSYINYTAYASFVSSAFILLTFLVYAVLPELRANAYGKCLMVNMTSLFFSCLTSSLVILASPRLGFLCFPIGFSVQFFWLSCFCMQTVLCYDILVAFSVLRNPKAAGNHSDTVKVGVYSIYGFGIPAIITLVTVALQFGPFLEDGNPWKPNMKSDVCFFPKRGDMRVRWLYFYGPYSVMIFINSCMFFMTAALILNHSRKAKTFRGSFRKSTASKKDKDMFRAHITLFFVMGSNWIIELVILIEKDTTTPDNWFWQVLDAVNNLIGFFLFVILVCRPKVMVDLNKVLKEWSTKIELLSQATKSTDLELDG